MLTRRSLCVLSTGAVLAPHLVGSAGRAQRGTGDLDPSGEMAVLKHFQARVPYGLTFREEHEAGLWCFLSGAIGGVFVLEGSRDPARVTSLWTVRQTRAGFSSANKSA